MIRLQHPEAQKKYHQWLQGHQFTATEIEAYQSCPIKFFFASVLEIQPEPRPDIELSPAEVGRLVHKILELFMRRHSDALVADNPSDALFQNLEQTATELFQKEQETHPQLSAPLFQRRQGLIRRALRSFLEQELSASLRQASLESAKSELRPRYYEWSFGGKAPLSLNLGKNKVSFAGRIDRIDVDERSKRFLIIDYKTGSSKITGRQVTNGESVQLPLYILAVQKLLLPGYEPIGAVYYQLSDMSKKDGILHADRLPNSLSVGGRSSSLIVGAQWENTFQKILENLTSITDRIYQGLFTSGAEPCRPHCPLKHYCTQHQIAP